MPRRNVMRLDAPESYYHVYARGNSKHRIFLDEQDFIAFLRLLERYLSPEEFKNVNGISYPNFYNKVDLLAYCLMPNHFHLFFYQRQQKTLTSLMQSVMTSYSRYFNKRYKRTGPLFESRFRASRITDDAYLQHITRYIHLNPRYWRDYEYSSLPYYLQRDTVSWLRPERVLELFESPAAYEKFVADYEENKKLIDILKKELANEW
ncbi:transposase [Candidatus Saccharibacteria bacterium]|jgi:putative transposase|nr:transposase [Candidatus Saccharibacteria bacterium]